MMSRREEELRLLIKEFTEELTDCEKEVRTLRVLIANCKEELLREIEGKEG